MNAATWRNWAGTATATPRRVLDAGSADEIAEAISAARDAGLRVKAVGSGHSFTDIAVTDGLLVRLGRLAAVLDDDPEHGLVTVQSGITLAALNRELDARGCALSNLGDIDAQTISGAISTGTHGTGLGFGGLAAQVYGLELVLADGSIVRCGPDTRPDLFAAARVGLGALGVITAVTLRCEPAYALHAVERPMPLDQVLGDLDRLVADHDHFEFYWFPHTSRTLTKSNNRVPDGTDPRPLGRIRAWLDDHFLANSVFEYTNRLCTVLPSLTPLTNGIATRALAAREYIDRSYRVFCSPRRVVFRETEWALPRAALPDVLRELDRWIERTGARVSFPVEVRFAPADDIWLSTAHARETAYIAVHQYHRVPYERYFRAVEAIALAAGGRPHWGKLHWCDAERLRTSYAHFDDFRGVRDSVDPDRVFGNPYLDRVLGP